MKLLLPFCYLVIIKPVFLPKILLSLPNEKIRSPKIVKLVVTKIPLPKRIVRYPFLANVTEMKNYQSMKREEFLINTKKYTIVRMSHLYDITFMSHEHDISLQSRTSRDL